MVMEWWQWICLAIALFLMWSFYVEPHWYRFRREQVKGLPKLKRPITILHLSDIHFMKKIGGLKRAFFQRLSMLNPDLIVLTGDVIDEDEGIATAKRILAGLRARYGTYMVLGNHDYYKYGAWDNLRYHVGLGRYGIARNNVKHFVKEMETIGVKTLINDSQRMDIHGNSVLICGTDDPVTQKIDFEKTMKNLSPKTFNLLLMHQLDGLLKLSHHGVDLAVSGHTHGGQIRMPFIGALFCDTKLPRRFVEGQHEYKGIRTFVSRGLGAGRHLFPRFVCRPEAILLELSGS